MTSPAQRSTAPRGRGQTRLWWLILLAGGVFVLGCVYVMVQLVSLRTTLDGERASQSADSTAITQLSTALEQTQAQLRQHGVKPVAPPPAEIVQGVPGATGAAGQSIVGPQGPPGKDAPTPNPTAIASLAAGMVHPSPGPSGPAGPQGQPGATSTVPGPQGQPGQNGTNGQPPAGWTTTNPDGSTTTCQRAANFDPSNPWYTCTTTPSPSPSSPSPTPPSQSATAGPGQAKPKPKHAVVSTGPR